MCVYVHTLKILRISIKIPISYNLLSSFSPTSGHDQNKHQRVQRHVVRGAAHCGWLPMAAVSAAGTQSHTYRATSGSHCHWGCQRWLHFQLLGCAASLHVQNHQPRGLCVNICGCAMHWIDFFVCFVYFVSLLWLFFLFCFFGLFVCLFGFLVCLFVCLFVCLLVVCLFVCLFVLFVCLFVCSVCFACLSVLFSSLFCLFSLFVIRPGSASIENRLTFPS